MPVVRWTRSWSRTSRWRRGGRRSSSSCIGFCASCSGEKIQILTTTVTLRCLVRDPSSWSHPSQRSRRIGQLKMNWMVTLKESRREIGYLRRVICLRHLRMRPNHKWSGAWKSTDLSSCNQWDCSAWLWPRFSSWYSISFTCAWHPTSLIFGPCLPLCWHSCSCSWALASKWYSKTNY